MTLSVLLHVALVRLSASLRRGFVATALSLTLAGCVGEHMDLPRGDAAYKLVPPAAERSELGHYKLVPGDIVKVNVYGEEAISVDRVVVDDAGNLELPLAMEVHAAGQTAMEVAQAIGDRLKTHYVRNPKVAVTVVEQSKQTVAVEGQVNNPGVFEIDRAETLLTALARAHSTSSTARLDQVVIFRDIDGHRAGARFNLQDIRRGKAPDPQVRNGDVIVVGFSSIKGAFRDFLKAAPAFYLFQLF